MISWAWLLRLFLFQWKFHNPSSFVYSFWIYKMFLLIFICDVIRCMEITVLCEKPNFVSVFLFFVFLKYLIPQMSKPNNMSRKRSSLLLVSANFTSTHSNLVHAIECDYWMWLLNVAIGIYQQFRLLSVYFNRLSIIWISKVVSLLFGSFPLRFRYSIFLVVGCFLFATSSLFSSTIKYFLM